MKNNYKIYIAFILAAAGMQACKKDGGTGGGNKGGGNTGGETEVINPPVEASVSATQGFFLDNWQPKTFSKPANAKIVAKPGSAGITATVDISQVTTKVSKYMFGNNTNPFMGQYVTEPALMKYLTDLSPNILRFPGGSLSDIYFWNQSNHAPADAPDQLPDYSGTPKPAGYWYGNNTESWTFTLNNYYKVLQQTNSTGIITVNYGYARYGTGANPIAAAAHLAADWVRYDNGRTKYWEVGNENYGNWEAGYRINAADNKDGQPTVLSGALYGAHFKVYADSMRKAAAEVGNTGIKIGMVTTEADETTNTSTIISGWNYGAMKEVGEKADFFVVHNYYTPYMQNSSPEVILNTPAPVSSSMMTWLATSASKAGISQKPVALDEWNIFSTGSKQMVSNVAGVHAVMVLGETLKNKFSFAARWDLANGWDNGDDHGLFNIGNEPGADKWSPRPAYYYMYYFQKYFGDRMVGSTVTGNTDIVSYGSSFTSGDGGAVLVNKGATDKNVTVKFKNFAAGSKYYYYTLNGGTDNAPFSRKLYINGNGPTKDMGGPANYLEIAPNSASVDGGIVVTVPARGAVFLVAEGK